ncbi:MAG: TonB-dependent receptor [Planctomycetota bacterium]
MLLQLAAAVAVAAAATAQQAGSIRGVVSDKDFDAPLAGAAVQVLETGQRVLTTDQGNFVIGDLRPGTYTVVVRKEGYQVPGPRRVVVQSGQLADVRFDLLGEFTDLEEYVVQDSLQTGSGTELELVNLRVDSAAQIDAISSEMLTASGSGDAAQAMRLIAGASTKDGKSAVIRGLPDRYVASQLNGVLLPSADEDKRAVELDQFPSSIIESVQVAKTFTPDQQGNASGGAVNVVLRGVPDKPLFATWNIGTSYNTQATGRAGFLTYDGGGVHAFGKSGSERTIQEEGQNWEGAVGTQTGEPPDNFKWNGALGGSAEFGDGWRIGGFTNFFYNRNATFFRNGKNDTYTIGQIGNLMSPQIVQGTVTQTPFFTSLLDITQSTQTVKWGGLSTVGIANDDHSLNVTHLWTRSAEDTVTLAEDTRGKQYFFPGHDPDDPSTPGHGADEDAAPYTRQQTIAYTERTTTALQVAGRHRTEFFDLGPLRGAELDWTWASNTAVREVPDRREFGVYWIPSGFYLPLKPAAEFTLGNLQRTFIKVEEKSAEYALNLKFPFELRNGKKGSFKAGFFQDVVDRKFTQETFSNFSDPTFQFVGQWDEFDWSDAWLFEDHPITAGETDVDYTGKQRIQATYLMLDVPLTERLRGVAGVRFEQTTIKIRSTPEADATWVPPGQFGLADLLPDEPLANPTRSQHDVLPSYGLIYDLRDDLTVRGSYSETLARQTFKELSPIFQQEYIGGPVFVGDPNLEISHVENVDFRVDYLPLEGSLFSVSWFRKVIDDPIEYVEAAQGFTFTKPVNYPRGTLKGWEVEARQELGSLWAPLAGINVGGNSTWIEASVRRPDYEVLQFQQFQGVRPQSSRDMTAAPDYLWNLFATYDLAATGTSLGVFYTVTGDTLLQGPGPSNSAFVPATYDKRYDNLSATLSQDLGRGVRLQLSVQNLTNAQREQFYSTEYLAEDVTRRTYKTGVTWALSIGGEIAF